jgi:hypothetical protein
VRSINFWDGRTDLVIVDLAYLNNAGHSDFLIYKESDTEIEVFDITYRIFDKDFDIQKHILGKPVFVIKKEDLGVDIFLESLLDWNGQNYRKLEHETYNLLKSIETILNKYFLGTDYIIFGDTVSLYSDGMDLGRFRATVTRDENNYKEFIATFWRYTNTTNDSYSFPYDPKSDVGIFIFNYLNQLIYGTDID